MPIRHILVGDAGGHIKHDDTALPVDVVAVTEAAEFLLPSGIPYIKLDRTEIL